MAEKTTLQERCAAKLIEVERYERLKPALFAGAEGRGIQRRRHDWPRWEDVSPCDHPLFSPEWEYRVKPEPQYRPYTPEEALKHIGRHFQSKKIGHWVVEAVGSTTVYWVARDDERITGSMPLDVFRDQCTWTDDDSPCGVLVEE